jgi:hypothetical protein
MTTNVCDQRTFATLVNLGCLRVFHREGGQRVAARLCLL